jgi:hypothetical protein
MAGLNAEDDGGQYNLALFTYETELTAFDPNVVGTRSDAYAKAMNMLRRITDYGCEVKTEEVACNEELDGFPDWLCMGKINLADASSMLFPKGVKVLLLRKKDSSIESAEKKSP